MARNYTLDSSTPARLHSGINYAAELNPQQCAAVTSPPGPALVIAGAGSGKTRTLTYRVAYLLDNGIEPRNILLLTFTNKAAREMLDRVQRLVSIDPRDIWGGTFHSIGNRVLRAHAQRIGWERNFTIMDREDQKDLLLSVYAECGIDPKGGHFPKPEVMADVISLALNTGETLPGTLESRYGYLAHMTESIEAVSAAYEKRKQDTNCFDFDDLLVKSVRLLGENPDVAATYQRRFEFVLVDEYQDTNAIQGELIDLFAAHHKNLMVVGDDAQSIYSWRGADYRNILDFSKRHPDAHVYKIETNYRSAPQILDLANASIRNNARQYRKELAPARPEAALRPAHVPLQDVNMQAAFVAQRLQELHEEGLEWSEMAVLYRAHYHSMEIQMELTRRRVPFTVTSGLRFFEQAHVKDAAAFMRFAANRRDEVAFLRMLRLLPGIGAKTAAKVWARWLESEAVQAETLPIFSDVLLKLPVPAKSEAAWAQMAYTLDELMTEEGRPRPPSEMLPSIIEGVYREHAERSFPNATSRLEDLEHLQSFARDFHDIEEFLTQLSLLAGQDAAGAGGASRDENSVCLSTVHQAKGLEWRAVFVVWLAEGMFPNKRVIDADDDEDNGLEEERRLFYVAVTRAEDQLYLTYPLWWGGSYGGSGPQQPSRFLEELPEEAAEVWNVGARRGFSSH